MLLRRHRIVCSLILLVAMLYTQLAVGAYACPELSPAVVHLQGEHAATSSCAALDADAPQLCWQHYHSDKQSAHHADAPSVSPIFVVLYLLPAVAPPDSAVAVAGAAYSPLLDRSVEPPVSIRNCCFRT